MSLIGDCFTCALTTSCSITNPKKVMESFTCELFQPVHEAAYLARLSIRQMFGELAAAQAIVNQEEQKQGGEPTDVDS